MDETCAKCGNGQMSVKTMQLRSADEGGKFHHLPGSKVNVTNLTLGLLFAISSYCILLLLEVWSSRSVEQLEPFLKVGSAGSMRLSDPRYQDAQSRDRGS